MSELYVEDPLTFWCNNYGISSADVVFMGIPLEGTGTGRSGTAGAPNAIRKMSYMLETYSPSQKRDLSELKMTDYGNLVTSPGDLSETSSRITKTVKDISEKFPVLVGGDHTMTLPAVRALMRRHPKLSVLQFDAHLDMKDEYAGSRHCHVTVMRRIFDLLGKRRIVHAGSRSFSADEMEFAKKNNVVKSLEKMAEYEMEGPVYVTLDMDVFDPSYAPGVATPVPGGISPEDFFSCVRKLGETMDVIGFDVVETCPPHDNSGITSLLAARAIKEMLLSFRK